MADNVGYTPGTGATIATDDVGGAHVQRVKLTHGPDGVANDMRYPTRVVQQYWASGNHVLWTPPAGKRFRLMRYQFEVSSNATLATPDYLALEFMDGGAVGSMFLRGLPWVGSTPGAAYRSGWIDLGDGYLSSAPGNALYFYVHAANDTVAGLTAGLASVTAVGMDE